MFDFFLEINQVVIYITKKSAYLGGRWLCSVGNE